METPGPAVRAVLVPAASGTRRKRAAGEAGAPTSRQRVLDEEEYIEVGLGVDASDFQATSLPRAPLPRAPPGSLPGYRRSCPLAKVEQPESLPSGCGQSGGTNRHSVERGVPAVREQKGRMCLYALGGGGCQGNKVLLKGK